MPLLADRRGSDSRVAGLLVAGLAVLVLVGTAAAYVHFQNTVDEATAAAAIDPAPLAASTSEEPSTSPTPTPTPTKPVSLWIGDGYTAGSGADSAQSGEACAAAKDLGWTCELDAERATGFLSNGHSFDSSYGTLADRLGDLDPDLAPDVVVIDAGRNDLGVYSDGAIAAAMAGYVKQLRAVYPSATLVQVVPWSLSQNAPTPGLAATVSRLMTTYDGYVVDPYADGWAGRGKTDRPALLAGTGGSNQAGHDLIGARLADSIRALDLPVPTSR